ncbi:MAG: ankyrin repeat domain-containing protein [Elusimicrobiaceae bacterium]|nr:ankyrin repeat domain-containing protein [Elusimicrobiaceae bacterium]
MGFKKTSTVRMPAGALKTGAIKPVSKVLEKAQKKPKLLIITLALIPLVGMLAFTLKGSISHAKPRKVGNINVIISRQTPQEIAEEATLALRKKDTATFLDILDTKVKDPNVYNSYGDTLLIAAATMGNVEAVQRLLAMNADVNKQNTYNRDTAVLRSVSGNHDEITALLVHEGANLNLPNNYRQTPMGLAVEKQKGQLVDLFLANGVTADVNADTLFRAVAKKNFVGVVGMLKGGVDPNVKNAQGNTPLIISSSLGDSAAVKNLLAYNADVNATNNEGNTALIYAARYNHPNTILVLLSALTMQYKTDLNMQNKRGETALYWAAAKGYAPVVKILLAQDADRTLKTKAGLTAYDAAKKYNRQKVMDLFNMPINELKDSYNQDIAARQ